MFKNPIFYATLIASTAIVAFTVDYFDVWLEMIGIVCVFILVVLVADEMK